MSLEKIKIGQEPDDGTGDTLREGAKKINAAIDQVNNGLKPFKIGELLEDIGEPIYRIHKGNHYRYIGGLPNTIQLSDVPGVSNVWRKVFFAEVGTDTDISSFYKEDSWSPTISKGVTAGLILGQKNASYTRIGNVVHYFIILTGVKTPVAGGEINITLPSSLPVLQGFGSVTINKIIVGSGGVNTPSDVILEGVYSTGDKVYIRDRYGRNNNIVFETPGTSLQISGTYKTNVYTP